MGSVRPRGLPIAAISPLQVEHQVKDLAGDVEMIEELKPILRLSLQGQRRSPATPRLRGFAREFRFVVALEFHLKIEK